MSRVTDQADGDRRHAAAGKEACPGCGLVGPRADGRGHEYMTASSACWAGYGVLLAAQYRDPARMAFHQLVVDAYAAQHPGGDDPRAIQSVGIHLMTLALVLEDGLDPARGPRLHRRMGERPVFHRLRREDGVAAPLTFRHVPVDGPVGAARERTLEWAQAVWTSWSAHHDVVRGWLRVGGLSRR